MKKRTEYTKGEKINGITFLRELPGERRYGYMRRIGVFVCPYCGNEFTAMILQVQSKGIKSCGCLYRGAPRKPEGCYTLTDVMKMYEVDARAVKSRAEKLDIIPLKLGNRLCYSEDDVKRIGHALKDLKRRKGKKRHKKSWVNSKGEITNFYAWMSTEPYRKVMINYQ